MTAMRAGATAGAGASWVGPSEPGAGLVAPAATASGVAGAAATGTTPAGSSGGAVSALCIEFWRIEKLAMPSRVNATKPPMV